MATSSGTSFALASLLTVLLFSGMQMYRQWLASSQLHTIFGGYLGSVLFLLILTNGLLKYSPYLVKAVGNIETAMFGKNFQTKLFPEVILCLAIAMTASGMVHRVCTTTCVIFSLVGLYYVNLISQQTYSIPVQVPQAEVKKKKK